MSSFLRVALFVGWLSASSVTYAQSGCGEIDKAIDEAIVAAALSIAEGEIFDKSAPQQTSRYLNLNNHLQVIAINVNLMAQSRCPARSKPINPMRYRLQAMECASARMKKEDVNAKCDLKLWRFE